MCVCVCVCVIITYSILFHMSSLFNVLMLYFDDVLNYLKFRRVSFYLTLYLLLRYVFNNDNVDNEDDDTFFFKWLNVVSSIITIIYELFKSLCLKLNM